MSDKKAENAKVLEIARDFMNAILSRRDWRPYAQLRARNMKVSPNIPSFSAFRVVKTNPPKNGLDPEQCRIVIMELTLSDIANVPPQTVMATMMAVREVNWETCPDCENGITSEEEACRRCQGTGRIDVSPARIPARGSDSYDNDVVRGIWGICPTSFAYIPGARTRITE